MTENAVDLAMEDQSLSNGKDKKWGLNRDIIKYFAMFTMFLNHFATVFLAPGTILYEIFTDIGYFTAVTMCYFLVEGYGYTHSKKKYSHRLLLFAVVSQVPYIMVLGYYQLNMLFTLWFCFLILCVKDKKEWGALRVPVIILIVLASTFMDWAWLAPVFTIMFAVSKQREKWIALSYAVAAVLFGMFNYASYQFMDTTANAISHAVFSSLGIIVSGIVMICFYNGKRAKGGQKFSKWFFYIFYPAHIVLLGIIRVLL